MAAQFRQLYLPYCLQLVGPRRYIVLNRFYKPLGETEFVPEYSAHTSVREFPKLTPKKIRGIAFDGEARRDGTIYLYDDGCCPTISAAAREAYAARLALLAKLAVE